MKRYVWVKRMDGEWCRLSDAELVLKEIYSIIKNEMCEGPRTDKICGVIEKALKKEQK
jgi:hypothetical protein